jgi:iron complex transport system ATP-binding protein
VSSASIITNNLSIGYRLRAGAGKASPKASVVQRDLSFTLYEGEMVCMLGPNGCGKSTLLRTLAGLQPPLGGTYTVTGEAVLQQAVPGSKAIALVLTERLSLENTSVHDIVALGRYPYTSFMGGLSEEDEQIIADSLRAVGFGLSVEAGLGHTWKRSYSEAVLQSVGRSFFNAHSDGEKQLILIAKALAQQTPVILLDEPTAHLDLPHRIKTLRLLRRLAHEEGKTILISTHELDLAMQLSDRLMLMTPHQGIALDSPEALKKADAFTSAFGMDIFAPLG